MMHLQKVLSDYYLIVILFSFRGPNMPLTNTVSKNICIYPFLSALF
jgi:hypothetical protein